MKTAWIGFSDERYENYWYWSMAGITNHETLTYKNWNSGQPSNTGERDCSAMTDTEGKWDALQCGLKNPFVCEYGKFICATKFLA